MATTPIVQSTGGTSGAGTAGQGRQNLVISETVTLSDTEAANSGASYVWQMVDRPIGSSATLTGSTTATPTFVPDITGSFKIKCTVNGIFDVEEIFAVQLTTLQARIPAFLEEEQYDGGGNTKGWHAAQTVFMRNVEAAATAAALRQIKVSSDDTTPGYVEDKFTAGTGIVLATLSPAGNEQRRISVTPSAGADSTAIHSGDSAGGDAGGTFPNFTVTQARGIRETSGPTNLVAGAIATTQLLQRVGATLVGIARAGVDSTAIHSGDAAGGDLGGTLPSPTVTQARGLRETSGPTTLVAGAIATTELLQRVGSTLVGIARAGVDSSAIHSGDAAGGDLGGTYVNPTVTQARGIRETSGPTTLVAGAIVDGEFLKRVGSTIVSAAASGGTFGDSYMIGHISTNPTGFTAASYVPFDTVDYERGTLALSGTPNSIVTLPSGSWLLIGSLTGRANSAGSTAFSWYSGAAAVGLTGSFYSTTYTSHNWSAGLTGDAIALVASSGSTQVSLRITATDQNPIQLYSDSRFLILKIGAVD